MPWSADYTKFVKRLSPVQTVTKAGLSKDVARWAGSKVPSAPHSVVKATRLVSGVLPGMGESPALGQLWLVGRKGLLRACTAVCMCTH